MAYFTLTCIAHYYCVKFDTLLYVTTLHYPKLHYPILRYPKIHHIVAVMCYVLIPHTCTYLLLPSLLGRMVPLSALRSSRKQKRKYEVTIHYES